MEPRLNVITLAVDDLERALVFYRDGLGLQTNGVVATELVDEKTGAAGAIVDRDGLLGEIWLTVAYACLQSEVSSATLAP